MSEVETVDDLKASLRRAGLRATAARIAVLRCLREASGPSSHAEVCELLGDAGFDRATIYRNLSDLTDVGLAVRSDLGDHLWRFEAVREGHEAHHGHPHFVCRECGTVACLPRSAVALRSSAGKAPEFRRDNVEIQLRGVCTTCA